MARLHAAKDDARIPRYRVIAEEVVEMIQSGHYRAGDLLPSESALSAQFGVARSTLRTALGVVAATGLVERRHGYGTVVCTPPIHRRPDKPISLTEELRARGFRPHTRLLALEELRPPRSVAESLHIGRRSTVTYIKRLRYADEMVIGVQETFVPVKFCPGLVDAVEDDFSVSAIIAARYRLRIASADVTIGATSADRHLGPELEIPVGDPVLHAVSTSYLPDLRPLERTDGWFRASVYRYQFRQQA